MRKLLFYLSAISVLTFTACDDDDELDKIIEEIPEEEETVVIKPEIGILINEMEYTDKISLPQDSTVEMKAVIKNEISDYSFSWNIEGNEVSTDSIYTFTAEELGEYTISLKVKTLLGGESTSQAGVSVYGKYKYGTFILNEGNMSSENGSLIFISPTGQVTDSVYWKVNNSFLGNVTQDLYIADNKMYIIAQNGNIMGGDGMLVVTNAETLKKENAYNEELSGLDWPTHLAVVENKVYIRDNKGVYLFNTSNKELNYIEGTKGASKNRMAVVGKKIFVPASKNIYVIEENQVTDTIKMEGNISGVLRTNDNNLWVSCTTKPAQINKVSSKDYSIMQTNEIAEAQVGAGWGATPGISAKGDTIYFSNASTKIYRHIFNQKTTELMTNVKDHIENAGIVYNNLAVDPISGEVYFNTIKGYGMDFLINDISVFDFSGTTPVLKADYKDHTKFPAGIFFPSNF